MTTPRPSPTLLKPIKTVGCGWDKSSICLLFALLLSACGNSQPVPTVTETSLPTKTSLPRVTETSIPPTTTDTPTAGFDKPTSFTNPEVAPTGTVIEVDVQGVKFAYGGEFNDIPQYRYDEEAKVWVEITPAQLANLIGNFPSTHENVMVYPEVTLEDGLNGRITRFAMENIDRENRIIPLDWAKSLYFGVNMDALAINPTTIPEGWSTENDYLTRTSFIARFVNEDKTYTGGVVVVFILKNSDNSLVPFWSVIDEEHLINNPFFSSKLCLGVEKFDLGVGEERLLLGSMVPAFNFIEFVDEQGERMIDPVTGEQIIGDSLGSNMIIDIYEQYGFKPLLDKFGNTLSQNEVVGPVNKSGSNIPVIAGCAIQDG